MTRVLCITVLLLVAAGAASAQPARTTPVPRALPDANSGLYLPRVDRMDGVLAFMARAGERSVMLRASTWFGDAHPLLPVDFSQPKSLADAGIATDAPVTISTRKDGRMTCHGLSDAKRFDERVRARTELMGKPWEGKVSGLSAVGSVRENGSLSAGVVRRGNVACVVSSRADARPLLALAANATGRAPARGAWTLIGGLPGEVYFVSGDMAVGATGDGNGLRLEGRSRRDIGVPSLISGATTPYATFTPDGLGVVRATVRPDEVAGAVRGLLRPVGSACAACPREVLSSLERTLPPLLTGRVAVSLHTAQVRGSLRSEADRYFAARHVWLAEVKDGAAVNKALASLERVPGAQVADETWTVPMDGGRSVQVGVRGGHLFLSNDGAALQAALAALPGKGGKLTRGMEVTIDPQRMQRTLSQVSLLDVIGQQELAGLLALSTELGPVLQVASSLTGWASTEKGGGQRFGAWLTLRPPE